KEELEKRKRASLLWSPDGKYFLVSRKDDRHLNEMWVINNVGGKRPTLETYKYQMPGEPDSTERELHLFDFATKTPRQLNVHAFKNQTLSLWSAPRPKNMQPGDIHVTTWLGTADEFFCARSSRDLKRIDILKMNVNDTLP